MAIRGILRVEDGIKMDPIVHLWTLRILVVLGAHREFVNSFGIQNDSVAKAIGLGHWVEPSARQFDPRTPQRKPGHFRAGIAARLHFRWSSMYWRTISMGAPPQLTAK